METTGLTAHGISLPKLSDNSENYPLFMYKNTLDNVYYQVKNGKNGGSDTNKCAKMDIIYIFFINLQSVVRENICSR